jgi:hypothetical protein
LPQPGIAMGNERWDAIHKAVMDKLAQTPTPSV